MDGRLRRPGYPGSQGPRRAPRLPDQRPHRKPRRRAVATPDQGDEGIGRRRIHELHFRLRRNRIRRRRLSNPEENAVEQHRIKWIHLTLINSYQPVAAQLWITSEVIISNNKLYPKCFTWNIRGKASLFSKKRCFLLLPVRQDADMNRG